MRRYMGVILGVVILAVFALAAVRALRQEREAVGARNHVAACAALRGQSVNAAFERYRRLEPVLGRKAALREACPTFGEWLKEQR